MKLIQLLLLKDHIHEYTKDGLAELSRNYGFDPEHIRFLLFRGTEGTFDVGTFPRLFSTYIEITNEYFQSISMTLITFSKDSLRNPTQLPPILFEQFVSSPNEHTQIFEEEWIKLNCVDYQSMFTFEFTPIELIKLPEEVKSKHFIQIQQRSEEWLRLLKFYRCGSNGAEIKETMEGTYNLLRGSITEALIMELFTPEHIGLDSKIWQKVIVGLIVADKDIEGSRGAAPDLLLVNGSSVIPVEIKTLTESTHSSEFFNKKELAEKQCMTIQEILGSDVIHSNLIIMSYWRDNDLVLECFH